MRRRVGSEGESGLTVLELLLVLAIICVVASMAFMQIASARDRVRLDSAAREFTGNLEKARADSIRRHAAAGQEASVSVIDATSYSVAADYNHNGTIDAGESRTFTLPEEVSFITTPAPPTASFDAQGRLTSSLSFSLTNSTDSTNINLTVAGDAALHTAAPLPTLTATPFPTGTPTPTATPTPTPVPPAGVGGCSIGLNPESMTIRKNGITTGQLDLTGSIYGDPGQATITFDSSQLRLTYGSTSTQASTNQTFTIGPTTSVRFTVRDIKNTTSGYTAYITVVSDCGEYITAVTVTN
jgi:prepilin-type N-terminal cleavage/methylation domain-containing protein